MKSLVIKRSIVITHHKTSVSLEDAFWKSLRDRSSAPRDFVQPRNQHKYQSPICQSLISYSSICS
jgi:hypothetical protein